MGHDLGAGPPVRGSERLNLCCQPLRRDLLQLQDVAQLGAPRPACYRVQQANCSGTLLWTVPRILLVLTSWCDSNNSHTVSYVTPGNLEEIVRNGARGTWDWIGPRRGTAPPRAHARR